MSTEKEKMIAGKLYNAGDPELAQARLNARRLVRTLNETDETDLETRTALLKKLFGSTGERLFIESDFRCDYGFNIHVGENFYANFDCVILDGGPVEIGKNCMLAPGVHETILASKRTGETT
ncbi:maltose acetyltransferase domain-containing protein, partial [Heyndrickxia coagulans]|uniref:maltose acetyltransferase domain-containing protein n=1 Tax=Heyndrickxia coagulans TaxID=1398 RepID=UPI003D1C6DA3